MLVAGSALGGCATGPGQVGSAAIVGSTAVPASEVAARLDQALTRTEILERLTARGVGAPDIARDIVTQAVLHELSVLAAADEGIVVTPAEVDMELALRGGVDALLEGWLYDLPQLRRQVGDDLIAEKLAAKQVNGLAVTVDIVGVASREEAEAAARALAAGGPDADALFADPQTSARAFEYRASVNPEIAVEPVFGTAVGDSAYFQPVAGQDSWLAFRVLDRRLDAPAVASELDAVPSIGKQDLAEIGVRLLQPVAARAGIRVNPRYGVWDPIAMRVVDEEQVAGAVLAPTSR